ncbi:hypothetical protein ACOBQB_22390 [Streptomyces sp. G5(2025)]|uniref:hypothetical protein n=1 Tax=Streptomyces sp. G5(2025) TaxID=3406628 RepID=UPI003C137BFE
MGSIRTLFSGDVDVTYGRLYVVSDPENYGDTPYDPRAGQTTGLCGAAVPGYLFLTTGLHTGAVGYTVELHEVEPEPDESWEEITEVSFRPVTPQVSLDLWGGDGSFPLALDMVDHRVRHCVSGMDEAVERELECLHGLVIERHLLQFWPAPPARDRLVKQTSSGAAYWHDVARKEPPPPAPEELAEAERRAREEERRAAEDALRREWGGQLPGERLLNVRGNVAGLRELAPHLLHALDRLPPEGQRAVARWAMRRAYEKAGLDGVDWVAPALDAVEHGQPLPPPFHHRDAVVDRLLSDPNVPDTTAPPALAWPTAGIRQQFLALPALYAAVDGDPLQAAVDALFAAAVTYGSDYGTLLAEARSAFPGAPGPATA